MRLAGYIRVSRVAGREGDSFISPSVQRERIAALAAAHGNTVAAWFEDLDQPGSRWERPSFQAALELVEQGGADGIACATLDRFARSVVDALRAVQRLDEAGGHLVIGDLGLDTSTPAGRMVRTVLLAFAEFQLDQIRAGWDTAKQRAVERGVHIASRVPPGYRRADDGRLEPDPQVAAVIAAVFDQRAAGASWPHLARLLNAHGVRGHLGGDWTAQTAARLIRRRVYLGEARQGDHVNPAAHEPLVTEAVWEQANTARRQAFRGQPRLLSGLARCAGCGYVLRGAGTRGTPTYACRVQHGGGVCPEPVSVKIALLDAHVEEVFLAGLREGPRARADESGDLAALEEQVAGAEAELAAYRDANLVSVIGADAYRDGLAARARTVDEARDRLLEQRRVVKLPRRGGRLVDEWAGLTVVERRAILTAGLDAVMVRRHRSGDLVADRVSVLWAGEAPAWLPRQGRLGRVRGFVFPRDGEPAAGVAGLEDAAPGGADP